MDKLIAALCCLMLAAAPALAQDKGTGKKGAPMTEKELADKKKATNTQAALCAQKSRQDKLKQGSKEFADFMTQCLNKKK